MMWLFRRWRRLNEKAGDYTLLIHTYGYIIFCYYRSINSIQIYYILSVGIHQHSPFRLRIHLGSVWSWSSVPTWSVSRNPYYSNVKSKSVHDQHIKFQTLYLTEMYNKRLVIILSTHYLPIKIGFKNPWNVNYKPHFLYRVSKNRCVAKFSQQHLIWSSYSENVQSKLTV